jgi:3',5'-cyclic AMP phosphodiesterase CpdA
MKTLYPRLILQLAITCILATPALAAGQSLKPLPGTGELKPSTADSFTFFVWGDNRPHHANMPQPPALAKLVVAARDLKPSFVISLGDTIYGKNPDNENEIARQYRDYLDEVAEAHVPVFNAPGNHEMDDLNDVPNQQMRDWYEKYMGQQYGAFSYGNSTFIALDSEEIAPAGTPRAKGLPIAGDKNLDPGYVSSEQLDWLRTQLEQNRSQTHIFLFMHHPIHAKNTSAQLDANCAQAIEGLIANYPNVAYVLAAHQHLYYNAQSPDNVSHPPQITGAHHKPIYLVSGGAGAPLATKTKKRLERGAFHHYLQFRVHGAKVHVKLIRV